MANHQSSTKEMSSASARDNLEPLHIQHSPLRLGKVASDEAQLASRVLAVARGAQVLAEIIHSDILAADNGDRPLFDVNSIDALAGLLSESMGMLANLAERRIDYFNASTSQGA